MADTNTQVEGQALAPLPHTLDPKLKSPERHDQSRRRARRWMAIVSFGALMTKILGGALLFAALAAFGSHLDLAALAKAIEGTSTFWLSAMGAELFIIAGYLGLSGIEAIIKR